MCFSARVLTDSEYALGSVGGGGEGVAKEGGREGKCGWVHELKFYIKI